MANGWTPERRKRQSELILIWDPSGRSTGPRTVEGKARSSINAFKHGGRSKFTEERIAYFDEMLRVHLEIFKKINEKTIS